MRLFQTMEVFVEAIEFGLQSGQLKCIARIDGPLPMVHSVGVDSQKAYLEVGSNNVNQTLSINGKANFVVDS
jgi:hypothetical protein